MTIGIHKITYDREADAAYIYLTEIGAGEVDRSVPVQNMSLILDFDADGTLIGIESLNPSTFPPGLLDQATEL